MGNEAWEKAVEDHPAVEIEGIGNYYGGLNLKREAGRDYWCIENYDGMHWEPCDPAVAAALRARIEQMKEQQS